MSGYQFLIPDTFNKNEAIYFLKNNLFKIKINEDSLSDLIREVELNSLYSASKIAFSKGDYEQAIKYINLGLKVFKNT